MKGRSDHRGLRLGAVVCAWAALGSGLLQAQASGQSGQLEGRIAGDGSPIGGAFVTITGGTGDRRPATLRSSDDGSFSFTGLAAGSYRICVQTIGRPFLDPCRWQAAPPSANVVAGQTTQAGTITLSRGQTIRVSLLDDKGLLAASNAKGNGPKGHVLIGVWLQGLFHPLRVRNKTSKGWDHDLVVPIGAPLELTISSGTFDLTDEKGKKVDPDRGGRIPIQAAAGSPPAPVVFHVTGIKGGRGN